MLLSVKYWAVAVGLTVLMTTSVWAAVAVDVSGTWRDTHGGVDDHVTIIFVQNGETLTGTIGYPNRPRDEILEGTITKKGEISFLIDTVTPDGQPFRGVHRGRLRGNGDTIKGDYTFAVNGGPERRVEWTASRVSQP